MELMKGFTATALTVPLIFGMGLGTAAEIDPSLLMPAQNYNIINHTNEWYSYGQPLEASGYEIVEASFERLEKIDIITRFANELIQNSRDLEPEFGKVINERFWDLI